MCLSYSDCYSAIENIARMKFNTRPDIYIKLQDLRHQLLKLSIRIQHVKAHSGITGNEMADQYSKEVAHKIPKDDIPAPFIISVSDLSSFKSVMPSKLHQTLSQSRGSCTGITMTRHVTLIT